MNARILDNLRHIKAAAEGTTAPAGRKKMTPAERARHASLVRWGKEQPFAARLEAVRQRRKAAKVKKAGGKGKAKKPAPPTPEQLAAEKEKIAAENRSKVFGEMGLPEDAAGALSNLMLGVDTDDDGGLVKLGLAEVGKDGTLRLTSAGRQLHRAASKGDLGAAKDAASRGRDRAATAAERETAKQEKEKQSKGGGGKKEKPKKEAKPAPSEEADDPPTDEEVAAETAAEVGLAEETVDELRNAADVGGSDSEELRELGFIDSDGDATPEAVNALDALERGDARGYRRAVRAARARKRREERQAERETEREKARTKRDAEQDARGKARQAEYDKREAAREERSKANQDKRVAAEVERIAAARARKGINMPEITALIDDLEGLRGDLQWVAESGEGNAIKAGRRNSSTDQATIDRGYALSEELCALFEQLGATVEEEEEGEAVEMVEGKAAEEVHAALDIVAVVDGSEVKALDGGGIGAYAVRFGSSDEPDLSPMRDYFTKSTDFWIDAWDRRPMLFHHAMDEDTADAPRIGTWTKAEIKDEGVWLEGQLDKGHRYYGAIKELVRRGVLRLSSDSAPHLVRREAKGDTHEVKRWPLLAASLTPTPAEPRLTAVSFKALVAELGLDDIHDNPEATEDDAARPDAVKAAEDDRARRLLLELDLVTLEATIV